MQDMNIGYGALHILLLGFRYYVAGLILEHWNGKPLLKHLGYQYI